VVLHAITGQAGLDLCSRQPVDCVILELELPDMSGFEVLLTLVPHPQRPKIPVIILTRIANSYLLDAAINNGAHAALHKSINSEEVLLNVICKVMATIQRGLNDVAVSDDLRACPPRGVTHGSQRRSDSHSS
jgi:CheY-like chemotaxis protein